MFHLYAENEFRNKYHYMYRELAFSYSVINNFPRRKKKLTFFLIPQLRFSKAFSKHYPSRSQCDLVPLLERK